MERINNSKAIRILIGFFLLGLKLLFFASCSNHKSNELVVGISCVGSPHTLLNNQGELEGFDIDLAHKISQKLKRPIIFKDMPFELLYSALKIDQVDVIGFSFNITQKRLQAMDMIDIYGKPKAEITIIFWQQIPKNIKTIEDLKDPSLKKPLAVTAETVWADLLEEYGIKNIMALEHRQDLVLPIQYGQALAVAVGPRHALALKKQYPEIKILKIPLEKPWGEGVGMGVKKGNVELKEKLEKAVKELKEDGTIDALKKKWFGEGAQ